RQSGDTPFRVADVEQIARLVPLAHDDARLLIDRDGVVEYVNPSFTSITQYSADEVRNRRLSELPALENLSELLFDARSALTQQNSWQGEFRSRRKNHEPYWG
ncbi:PAS domain-containing protein, partial [Acinetobacter baumannii]